MNNNCDVETDRNRSVQRFGDFAAVDTVAQVERDVDKVSPNKTLLSGIREVAECLEQPLYSGKH